MSPTRQSSLSPARRRLVELMQRVNFGRIEAFAVRGGQPLLDHPRPRVVLELKFGADNGPRPEAGASGDFLLKPQVVELFAQFDRLGDARVESLVVKHGVPFSMHVEAGG